MENNSLKLIFVTQSTSLNLFWNLYHEILNVKQISNCGWFITNKYEFKNFARNNNEFFEQNDKLFEWDIVNKSKAMSSLNKAKLNEWEKLLTKSSFWESIIVDRRLGYPINAQFSQNYKKSYTHEQLLKILYVALDEINSQIQRVKPDAILGLNGVTLYDHLYSKIADYLNIPYLQLKLTRIKNYVTWFTNPLELSPHLVSSIERLATKKNLNDKDKEAISEAKDLLPSLRTKTIVYEGSILNPGDKKNQLELNKVKLSQIKRFKSWKIKLLDTIKIHDDHYYSPLKLIFQLKIIKPLRKLIRHYKFDVANADDFLKDCNFQYALFPLNTEPEVALLTYGRPYRNQIETIRNIATSLPVAWKLLVKEHPNAIGYRKKSFYEKLKQIPNVILVDPTVNTDLIVNNCELVCLVYGTIGFEAIVKKKPLIVFTESPYNWFPTNMVKFSEKPWKLGEDIKTLIENYLYNEDLLIYYIGAHIRCGVKINLFTQLLAKPGRTAITSESTLDEQYKILSNHTIYRINEEIKKLSKGNK